MAISGGRSTDQLLADLQNAITGLPLTVPEGHWHVNELILYQNLWPTGNLGRRAHILLEHLYETYMTDDGAVTKASGATIPTSVPVSPSKSALIAALTMSRGGSSTVQNEVDVYLSGLYPCPPEQMTNPLQWWKQHETTFPILSRIARDVLAIPAVSVAVERLFSSSKHTLSDSRSSMTAETASAAVITKELLKLGLGDGIQYLDGVSIH